jgi:hypothetical protein
MWAFSEFYDETSQLFVLNGATRCLIHKVRKAGHKPVLLHFGSFVVLLNVVVRRPVPDAQHRTPGTEHRTPNTEHRTPNQLPFRLLSKR